MSNIRAFAKSFFLPCIAILAGIILSGCGPSGAMVKVRSAEGDICVRATKGDENTTAAYLVLDNYDPSDTEWFLVGASSPQAGSVEIHTVVDGETEGTKTMQKVDRLSIPPQGSLVLAPRREHLMLFDASIELRADVTLNLTVESADGVQQQISATTQSRSICGLGE
ncbi:MAG: copper chaperone PCu(A)C [Gammaproteobacteria bacterium AqS3]|nr:copper chaperone PCu(A)C [Gammaproteobacteria bacterium AqS3]